MENSPIVARRNKANISYCRATHLSGRCLLAVASGETYWPFWKIPGLSASFSSDNQSVRLTNLSGQRVWNIGLTLAPTEIESACIPRRILYFETAKIRAVDDLGVFVRACACAMIVNDNISFSFFYSIIDTFFFSTNIYFCISYSAIASLARMTIHSRLNSLRGQRGGFSATHTTATTIAYDA